MAAGPSLTRASSAFSRSGCRSSRSGCSPRFLVQTDDRLGGDLVFSPGDVEALGEGLRIANPTFTGTTRGQDTFRFTADLVVPDAAPPEGGR